MQPPGAGFRTALRSAWTTAPVADGWRQAIGPCGMHDGLLPGYSQSSRSTRLYAVPRLSPMSYRGGLAHSGAPLVVS